MAVELEIERVRLHVPALKAWIDENWVVVRDLPSGEQQLRVHRRPSKWDLATVAFSAPFIHWSRYALVTAKRLKSDAELLDNGDRTSFQLEVLGREDAPLRLETAKPDKAALGGGLTWRHAVIADAGEPMTSIEMEYMMMPDPDISGRVPAGTFVGKMNAARPTPLVATMLALRVTAGSWLSGRQLGTWLRDFGMPRN